MRVDKPKEFHISWSTTLDIWWLFMRPGLIATIVFSPILSLAYAVQGIPPRGLGIDFMLTSFIFLTAPLLPGPYILAHALNQHFVTPKVLAEAIFRGLAWRLFLYPILFSAFFCAVLHIALGQVIGGNELSTIFFASIIGFLLAFLPASLLALRHALNKHLGDCHDQIHQKSSSNINGFSELPKLKRIQHSALVLVIASSATVMAATDAYTQQLDGTEILGVLFYFLTGLYVAYSIYKIKYIARLTPDEETELEQEKGVHSLSFYTSAAGILLGNPIAKWNSPFSWWLELLLCILLGLAVLAFFYRLLQWFESE
jgi:hypothetical protein